MKTIESETSKLKLVYSTEIPVRWRDLDDFGHVNNSVYFTYFEQARVDWWLSLGLDLKSKEAGPILVTADCTFLKPIFHPSTLLINTYAGLPGTSSYLIYYEVFIKKQTLELAARGNTKVVWVNYQLGKSLPLPEDFRRLLATD
jgi:acyl-CoA thioester hydrolase